MKLLNFLIIISCVPLCKGQTPEKTYKIDTANWSYKLPEGYKVRTDQFSEALKRGQKEIETKGQGATASNSDVILISAAKGDSSDINVILASYKGNQMILNFGLAGYKDKLIEYLKYSFETNHSNFKIEEDKILIDSVLFYTIENKMYDPRGDYVYSSMIFIGEVSNKEVSFSLTFDNQRDKDLLVNSLVNSKFKK